MSPGSITGMLHACCIGSQIIRWNQKGPHIGHGLALTSRVKCSQHSQDEALLCLWQVTCTQHAWCFLKKKKKKEARLLDVSFPLWLQLHLLRCCDTTLGWGNDTSACFQCWWKCCNQWNISTFESASMGTSVRVLSVHVLWIKDVQTMVTINYLHPTHEDNTI